MKRRIAALIICGTLSIPTCVQAKGHSGHHSSHRSNHSTKISKSVTKSFKRSNKVKITKSSKKTKVNINKSKNITVNVKKTKVKVNYKPTYYRSYRSNYYYGNSSDTLFRYYMLDSLIHRDRVSESDLVYALERKGYSNYEIDRILRDDRLSRSNTFLIITSISVVVIISGVAYIIYKKNKKY